MTDGTLEAQVENMLLELATQEATGALTVSNPDGEQSIVWFRDGRVYSVSVPGRRPLLGVRLMSSGALTPESLAEALEVQRTELQGWRLGELLVHLGFVDRAVVEAFVLEQVRDQVADLLHWRVVKHRFRNGQRTRQDVAPPSEVTTLLAEAHGRDGEWSLITSRVGGPDSVPVLSASDSAAGDVVLGPYDWALLCKVDGVRSIADLADDCGFTVFEAGRVVDGLATAGLVDIEPVESNEPDEPIDPVDESESSSEDYDAETEWDVAGTVARVTATLSDMFGTTTTPAEHGSEHDVAVQSDLEAQHDEAIRLDAERMAAEIEAVRLEAERLEAEEAERLEAERLEAERLEAERLEAERLEAERLEAERLEAERLKAERLEAERLEAERLAAEEQAAWLEAERIAAEEARLGAERLEAERVAAEEARLGAERLEAERVAAEAERLEAERLEAERVAAEEARLEAERLEAERLAAEEESLVEAASSPELDEESARLHAALAEPIPAIAPLDRPGYAAMLTELVLDSTATDAERAVDEDDDILVDGVADEDAVPAAPTDSDERRADTTPALVGAPDLSEQTDTAALLRELSSLGGFTMDSPAAAPAAARPVPRKPPPEPDKKRKGLFRR